jgi:hypothetical protein
VATFELRVRLLADLGQEGTALQRAALGTDLTPLVEMICDDYEATADDRAYLKAVANIRNKLFHLELSRVTGRVRPLGEQLKEGGAWMANLTDGSVDQVSKTKTQDGRIFGWMLESVQSGAFDAVVAAVAKATTILHALRDQRINAELASQGLTPEPS